MAKLTGNSGSGSTKPADAKRAAQGSHAVRAPKIISSPQAQSASAPKQSSGAPTKSPAPSAPKKAAKAPKKNDLKTRMFLTAVGGALLVFSVLKFQEEGAREQATSPSFAKMRPADVDDSMRVFTPLGEDTLWDNPEQGIIERNFCRGNQNSANCSHAPMHPFSEEFTRAGWSEKEYVKYLGWDKYPRESQNRVISETVTYENKAFKFR